VRKELEKLRVAGAVGSSLDAEVDLYCEPELATILRKPGDELRFALLTSYARVHAADVRPADAVAAVEPAGLWTSTKPSQWQKCERCWHHREDIGQDAAHSTLCARCVENITGKGEVRHFA
jgi:isoleucyl-tRNA synthetase